MLGRVLLPIPFEVGLLFKTFPERFIDEELGRQVEKDPAKSVLRGLGTSLNVPILNQGMGIQLVKPLAEYVSNKNSFTRSEIVPFYQSKLEPELQPRPSTNALVNENGTAIWTITHKTRACTQRIIERLEATF